MPNVTLASFFELVQLVGTCLTLYRLISSGLIQRYRFFSAYLVYRIPAGVCTIVLSPKSISYFYFWIWTTPILWILYILVVRELYGLVLARHKGLYTLGKWALYFGVAIAVAISVVSHVSRATPGARQRSGIITYFMALDQAVYLSMTIFLVLMLLLLSQYFRLLSWNVVSHAVLFALLFLSNSIGYILRNTFGFKLYGAIDTALMGAWAICAMGWFFLLSAAGEKPREALPVMKLGQENRVLQQLDALNASLLNAGRK